MEIAHLIEMGRITTIDEDGKKYEYKFALVIEFDNADSIRKAIEENQCKFVWGK